ncbi:hypothetical protein [Alkalibacterium sp.]|nr:MAG: hypothetical protein EA249_03925 [Alkalibacterium sp.]
MIERYIYAVTRELPEKNRKEVALDLKTLIYEMIDEKDNALTEEEKIEQVLKKLGNPKKMAVHYRGKERYLVGPVYFEQYLFFIRIVIFSIVIGVSVAAGLTGVFSDEPIAETLLGYFFTLFSASLQGAAWVTAIFALLEYFDVKVGPGMNEEEWNPSQLPELPETKALISRGESVFSIVMSTVFLLLFLLLSDRIGIYYDLGREFNFIPLFNVEAIDSFLIFVILVFMINILVELIKIIKGKWTPQTALITTVLNVISAALFIAIINNKSIWNNDIIIEFEQYMPVTFDRVIVLVTVFVIIVTIAESGSAIYRAYRYG